MSALDAAIRARLDEYEQGDSLERHDDALRAVLDEHKPMPLTAGELSARFGEGRCAYCHLGEPDQVYEGDLYGRRMRLHDHADPEPSCRVCHSGNDYESYARWPCPTVLAIARALGVDVPTEGGCS